MTVEIVGDNLVITLPVEKKTSKTGKSTLIASSGGIKPTALIVDGQPVYVNAMAFIQK